MSSDNDAEFPALAASILIERYGINVARSIATEQLKLALPAVQDVWRRIVLEVGVPDQDRQE